MIHIERGRFIARLEVDAETFIAIDAAIGFTIETMQEMCPDDPHLELLEQVQRALQAEAQSRE